MSAEDFRFLEEVGVKAAAGVEDFDSDEAVVFPVEDDECPDAFWRGGGDAGAAAGEPFVSQSNSLPGDGSRFASEPVLAQRPEDHTSTGA